MTNPSYDELKGLNAIANVLAQPWDLRDQLEKVLDEMNIHFGMQHGMISLLDQETGKAWLEITYGITSGETDLGVQASNKCVPIVYDMRVSGILSADRVAKEEDSIDREMAMLSSIAALIAKTVHIVTIEEENHRLRRLVDHGRTPSMDIIGHSRGMADVFGLIGHVADMVSPILICGETGTGKGLTAQTIHAKSSRNKGPFVHLNCAAVPESMIESELFGFKRGAPASIARRHQGKFEEAQDGSIFLDEISELSLKTQAKLLKVLQEKRFEARGSCVPTKKNARIIVSTSHNLEDSVAAGTFRADLYYRLNAFPIYLPPLRERGNDIILLADHFVLKYAKQYDKVVRRISAAVIESFLYHQWPGNIRELENCIERAVLLTTGDSIEIIHLPPSLQIRRRAGETNETGRFDAVLESQESSLIIEALKEAHGNQSQAARILGTTKRIIQYKIKKLGIDPWKYRLNRSE
jgi:Nif-specific regulatory protein